MQVCSGQHLAHLYPGVRAHVLRILKYTKVLYLS